MTQSGRSNPDFLWNVTALPAEARRVYNDLSIAATVECGQRRMFEPRIPNPYVAFPADSAEKASYYDTSPLRETLLQLVDFDCIERRYMRVSLGAVNIKTGAARYFDNQTEPIDVEHVMASAALPPAFPAVAVDRELYWDGGSTHVGIAAAGACAAVLAWAWMNCWDSETAPASADRRRSFRSSSNVSRNCRAPGSAS